MQLEFKKLGRLKENTMHHTITSLHRVPNTKEHHCTGVNCGFTKHCQLPKTLMGDLLCSVKLPSLSSMLTLAGYW